MSDISNRDTPDLSTTEVQKAWLKLNEKKVKDALQSAGFPAGPQKGESEVKVAEYARHGSNVSVIFIDSNEPPQVVTVALLSPTGEDGLSWDVKGYIGVVGTSKQMKTFVFEKIVGSMAPNLSTDLDSFLARYGKEREKSPIENAF